MDSAKTILLSLIHHASGIAPKTQILPKLFRAELRHWAFFQVGNVYRVVEKVIRIGKHIKHRQFRWLAKRSQY